MVSFEIKNLNSYRKPYSRFKSSGIKVYKNLHLDSYKGKGKRSRKINFSGIDGYSYKFSFISVNHSRFTDFQLNSLKNTSLKLFGKQCKLDFLVKPYLPVFKKPQESRMGKGKGNKLSYWLCYVKPGQVIFEVSGSNLINSKLIFKKISSKVPFKLKLLLSNKII